jgi:hypothetical protein
MDMIFSGRFVVEGVEVTAVEQAVRKIIVSQNSLCMAEVYQLKRAKGPSGPWLSDPSL